jgi:hypothetical protein
MTSRAHVGYLSIPGFVVNDATMAVKVVGTTGFEPATP